MAPPSFMTGRTFAENRHLLLRFPSPLRKASFLGKSSLPPSLSYPPQQERGHTSFSPSLSISLSQSFVGIVSPIHPHSPRVNPFKKVIAVFPIPPSYPFLLHLIFLFFTVHCFFLTYPPSFFSLRNLRLRASLPKDHLVPQDFLPPLSIRRNPPESL